MLFPRTIRLDDTDGRVFETAAAAGEWAVTGAFMFADVEPMAIYGKQRQAFRNGFLGLESFGWSTLVAVARIEENQYQGVIDTLAAYFVSNCGAPGLEEASAVARDEAAFAAGLCDHPVNTLLALDREHEEQGIVERFRVIQPTNANESVRTWEIAATPTTDGN